MRKRKSKYIKALAVVLSMMTIMAGLPIPATVGYSIGEEIMEPAAEQPEEVMEPETIAEETEIDESEEVLPDEETETEQPQDEPPQEEPPADAEGQTEIAPEAPTESVSPDEGVTEEIPENAPSEEHPLEEQPVQDDSVLIEESEETEEPTENAEGQPSNEVTEDTLPDELPAEEVMPEDDGVEAEPEESMADEMVAYEHPVKAALTASEYAYLMTERDVQVFASPDMQELIFTISPNGILLVTAFIEQETNILEVQFMTASGETITGYVYADELPDNLLTSSDIDAAAFVTNFSLVFVGDGKVAVFEVAGETYIPISTETPAEMEQPEEYPEEETPSEQPVETPAEDDPLEQPEEPQLEDSPLEESSQSEETELPPAEDETMEEVPESEVLDEAPMMFAAAPMMYASYPYGFSLRDHYGYTGYFYAGQTNVHGSSGDDSYPQLAASDEEGTIYATPHYLDGVVVYCLEHKYPGPGERDGDDDYEPTGPYTIVDLAGYKTTRGYSGDVFSDRTMHAIAWVIRRSYPFMVIDSYDSENENWSRAAGQFAIRQVIRELEGKEYVRSYWDLDDFYRRADNAPAEYLEYARWLAANAIAYGESAGTINVSNKSVSYSNGMCIGIVTVTTDAGQMRVSRSVGSMTGNSGGQDGSYYYLYSGDTITVSAAGTGFTMTIETMASSDEEAYFLVGVSDERIQKGIIPQEGEPYPLASTSVSFEVPHGSVSVTKKDADSGAALSGAVFELLSGSSILQTVTTGANGTATFSNVQPGSYTVREVSAPEGYRLAASSTQNVTVSIGQTTSVTFNNEQKEGKIRIVKTDQLTGRPLADAEFTITRLSAPPAAGNTGVGESVVITTDANGHAETGWLPYGRYRVEETGVPENYVDNRLSTTVDAYKDSQTYTVEVQNEPLKGYISLTKTDRLDGQPIAGVQFDIFHNDEYGDGLAGTMTTNANGVATSPPLRMGSYIVREHGEPSGYITELVEFEAAVEPDETTELTATNQPIQGYICIVKSDDLTGEVLADAEFTITRVSGLSSHNGSDDGEVVAVITTDENGVATSPLLTWGTYRVEETGVPEHYVDKQFSVDVSISEHMQTYQVVVENEPTKGTIRLTKTDRLDGQPIAGVQFDIYKNKKRLPNDPENMSIHMDVHAPIIDRATWEKVQGKRGKTRKRKCQDGEKNMFSGLLVCADCGCNLNYHFNQSNHDIRYYNRSNYNSTKGTCTSTHYIRVDFLEQVILSEIRRLTKFASQYESDFVKAVMGYSQQAVLQEKAYREKELEKLMQRDHELDRLFERLYEDNITGKISDERFSRMSANYEKEQAELAETIKKAKLELEKHSSQAMTTDAFIAIVRKYTRAKKLTPRMLNELIQRIEVHQAEKLDGIQVQRLTIHYNCVGTLDIPDEPTLETPKVVMQTRKGVRVAYEPAGAAI